MCGIVGFTWKDEKLVKRMADVIRHRGPDQEGLFCDESVSLGHRRLSIIDLSDHGRQPMANEDGSVRLVFNGEIYNFQDLREELIKRGHVFGSRSDTEVIIHAYEEYGTEAVHKLRGMFAFALWDSKKRMLWLTRDRIGIKPLYYYHEGSKLVFGSEIKSILEDRSIPRQVNHQALYDYLGFEFVPAPETMFRNIQKLPAGHQLIWQDGRAEVKPYWDLNMAPRPNVSFDEGVEALRYHLDSCVKSHLVSDVPLGVFLSGGLDSSALVAMMRRHISGPLRTFTIGYEDKSFSEVEYAKIVADAFGTEHHVLMIDDMKPEYVEKALWHLDEPMTDLSTVPLMLVCRKAREFITVCLSGEGGDESFAGYDRFKASQLNQYFSFIPAPVRRYVVGSLVNALPDQHQKKGAVNMLKRFVEGANLPADGHHLRWQYFSGMEQDLKLFSTGFREKAVFDRFRLIRNHMARCNATDRVNREVYLDMRFMMTDSVLMKVDKMSMASSLEIRVPLIDHVFVEYMGGLPGSWKLRRMMTKYIFRSALKGILPDSIVYRGKQGYSLPVKHLLRGQLKDYMVGLLNESPVIRENMNRDHINTLIAEHLAMKHNHNHVLWALMNVAIWHNKFLKG